MWSGNFKSALSGLRQSRWRSTFTMLGIIIGIVSVVTIVSLGDGLKRQVTGQISRLGSDVLTVRPGNITGSHISLANLNLYSYLAPSTLTPQDVDSIQHVSSVETVAPIDFVTDTAGSGNAKFSNVFVAGTTSGLWNILRQNAIYGTLFSNNDSTNQDDNIAVIGSDISTRLFGVLNPVGDTIKINGQAFTVYGVLPPSSGGLLSVSGADLNSSVFIPESAAQSLSGYHSNVLQIFAKIKPGSNVGSSQNAIQQAVYTSHNGANDFTVLKQSQLLDVSGSLVTVVTSFMSGIAAIALVVGGIGIMNIMLVSVSERTREIGIRKAIGATNRQILTQFLVEGLALTVGGGIIGILCSLLINQLLRIYSSWRPEISVPVVILAVGISLAAGLIFSIAPALKAARKNPIDALRAE